MKLEEGKWVARSIDGKERRFKRPEDAEAWKKVDTRTQRKPTTFRQYMDWAEREEEKLQKQLDAAKPKSLEIWSRFHTAAGEAFPDGDPMDRLAPWLRQHGLTMRDVDAAVKEHGDAEDAHAYLAQMWDDYSADAEHDATQGAHGDTYDDQWFQRPNPWK